MSVRSGLFLSMVITAVSGTLVSSTTAAQQDEQGVFADYYSSGKTLRQQHTQTLSEIDSRYKEALRGYRDENISRAKALSEQNLTDHESLTDRGLKGVARRTELDQIKSDDLQRRTEYAVWRDSTSKRLKEEWESARSAEISRYRAEQERLLNDRNAKLMQFRATDGASLSGGGEDAAARSGAVSGAVRASPRGEIAALPASPLPANVVTGNVPTVDVAAMSIAYGSGDHWDVLRTDANQVPPFDPDRRIRVHRCNSQVGFQIRYETQGASRQALNFDVRLSVNGREAGSTRGNGGRNEEVIEALLSPGEYVLQAMVDGANEVLESDESNNRLFASVVVFSYPDELNCGSRANAAVDIPTDPRAHGAAADVSGVLNDTPASTPDGAVLNDALTRADLMVSLSDPMERSITVTNQGHSATTGAATISLGCAAISGGPCPDLAVSPNAIPPLPIGVSHMHTIRGWPRQWDWPRGEFRFTVSINEDGSVNESASGNTAISTKAWNPSMTQVQEQCMGCHIPDDSGQGPSPDDLAGREAERGFQSLVNAAIGGRGRMPPRGGIDWLTDVEVAQLVRNLVDLGDPSPLSADGFYSEALITRSRSTGENDALEATRRQAPAATPKLSPDQR